MFYSWVFLEDDVDKAVISPEPPNLKLLTDSNTFDEDKSDKLICADERHSEQPVSFIFNYCIINCIIILL